MSPCIPEMSYYATPEFLSLFLHFMSAIEIPIHLFGAWIVVFRTPKAMSSVKWPMLNLHFWSAFLDVSISLLTTPYLLLPTMSGFPLGLLKDIGISSAAQAQFVLTIISFMIVSLMTVYSNRYYVMLGNSQTIAQKRFRIFYMIVFYAACIIVSIPFRFMVPEQKSAVATVFASLPCLPTYVYESPIFVYSLNMTSIVLTCFIFFMFMILCIIIFITLTVRHLLEQRKSSVSQKTVQLQKKFMIGLGIQSSVLMGSCIVPIKYMGYACWKDYYSQAFNNFAIIGLSFHGLFSTFALLFIYQPYRQATLSILFGFWKNRNVKVSSANNFGVNRATSKNGLVAI